MPKLCQGQIVWIDVADSRGHNSYARPVVILNRSDEIESEEVLDGAVASNTAYHKSPRPEHYIEVPHHPQGRTQTRLTKPTVVCCDWLVKIQKSDLVPEKIKGRIPYIQLELIIEKIIEMNSD